MSKPRAGKRGWAIIQLVDSVGGLPVAEVERDLLKQCPAAQLYFPAVRAGLLAKGHALNTYAFAVCPDNPHNLLTLERSYFVESVLREPRTHTVQRLTDPEMARLIQQQAGDTVHVTDAVRVTAGDWSGIEGTVVEVLEHQVKVLIELWSRRSVLTLPRNEIQPV